ncbi:MAG TPA: NmrA family NAD(P)-binding protein, partial [Candidatus Nanopelagicales bacterium]|nr:NmrA family NAD(P)-binding protein [Candidatus Nanopelagicales bacterium]
KLFLLRPPQVADVRKSLLPVIDEARRAGIRQIAYLSIVGAQRVPITPHARVERHLAGAGVPYTLLRAGFFMQNLLTTHAQDLREHGEIFVPAGRGRLALVDTRDVAAVAARALLDEGHAGQAVDLTGPDSLDFHEVAAIFTEVLGRSIRYPEPSPLRFAARWARRGTPLSFVAVMTAIYLPTYFRLTGEVTPDVGRILGRPPATLRRFVEEHRARWT